MGVAQRSEFQFCLPVPAEVLLQLGLLRRRLCSGRTRCPAIYLFEKRQTSNAQLDNSNQGCSSVQPSCRRIALVHFRVPPVDGLLRV